MAGQVSPPHMNAIVTKSDKNSELRPGPSLFRIITRTFVLNSTVHEHLAKFNSTKTFHHITAMFL